MSYTVGAGKTVVSIFGTFRQCDMARVNKNLFRQWYSKLGNTHEQLFHAWRSFSFDENTETIDSYVTRIRQVAALLCYGEPQVLEVFKNMPPTKLYWILFPI